MEESQLLKGILEGCVLEISKDGTEYYEKSKIVFISIVEVMFKFIFIKKRYKNY